MTDADRAAATDGLTGRLREVVLARGVRTVATYRAVGSEPQTGPFVAWALAEGLRVLLPVSRQDGLLDWALAGGEERMGTHGAAEPGAVGERLGLHGIPEPVGERLGPDALSGVDLLLAPAAAVGPDGARLGWGRGYFDRALGTARRRPPVLAVVFDTEFGAAVPREPHDQPVDGVVTPTRTVLFGSGGSRSTGP